jgi:hypothetical protein
MGERSDALTGVPKVWCLVGYWAYLKDEPKDASKDLHLDAPMDELMVVSLVVRSGLRLGEPKGASKVSTMDARKVEPKAWTTDEPKVEPRASPKAGWKERKSKAKRKVPH